MSIDAEIIERTLVQTYRVPQPLASRVGNAFAQASILKVRVERLEADNAKLRALLPAEMQPQGIKTVTRRFTGD